MDAKDILDKYGRKLEQQLYGSDEEVYSPEYEMFKQEMAPELTRYERWAKSLGSLIKIKVSGKDRERIQKFLNAAHLDVSAEQSLTLALLSMLGIFFLTILSASAIFFIQYGGVLDNLSSKALSNLVLFVFLGVLASLFVFYYTYSMPRRLASVWRLRAGAQMVPAILYVVVYMKHTSNLERAVEFAAKHLEGPLALDFKKIFYDVEVGRFSTIKQALGDYLEGWREYAPEFIESFHLIESSLFESSETRRVEILERALQVILDGVYEKMLKYSREIRSPLTNIYMLGIILPTLGLAMLPLASTLLGGVVQWTHVFIIFNVIIPFLVYYMVSEVLMKRPGGYGETRTIEMNPNYSYFKSKKPWIVALIIALPFFIIGVLPFLFQWVWFVDTLGLKSDYTFQDFGLDVMPGTKFFDFKDVEGGKIGPFGPVAVLLSLFVPFSFMIFFFVAYSRKTTKLIKFREDTDFLEEEFANSLFQLGNRLGEGVPAESAFGRVAESTRGLKSGEFFSFVDSNVRNYGMSVERAIFDPRKGAIVYYPSALIATSMRILVEGVRKGLKIAARSLMSISEYVKNIQRINQRLKDLLAEIVSDMKSNMNFLAPMLSGIVVGLASMITFILNKLESLQIEGGGATAELGVLSTLPELFRVTEMIPPYFLQISIGIYIIQVIFVLTGALVVVNSGKDSLREKYELSRNLRKGIILYLFTAFIAVFALSLLAGIAVGGFGG